MRETNSSEAGTTWSLYGNSDFRFGSIFAFDARHQLGDLGFRYFSNTNLWFGLTAVTEEALWGIALSDLWSNTSNAIEDS